MSAKVERCGRARQSEPFDTWSAVGRSAAPFAQGAAPLVRSIVDMCSGGAAAGTRRVVVARGVRCAVAAVGLWFVGVGCEAAGGPPVIDGGAGSDGPLHFPGVIDPAPVWGPIRTAPVAPPAISGGTLTVLADGRTAVAADPDRDRIFVVDVPARRLLAAVPLAPGDEPGRVHADPEGRVHVVLRRAGSVLTLTGPDFHTPVRRSVCPAPRGLATDRDGHRLFIVCAGGEFVSLPADPRLAAASGNGELARVQLDRDLRDVILYGDHLLVSRFRSAEVLVTAPDGTILKRLTPGSQIEERSTNASRSVTMTPAVAWRLVPGPPDGALMLHQRGQIDELSSEPGSYGASLCGGVVQTAVTPFVGDMAVLGTRFARLTLAVDLAYEPTSKQVAIVAPGNAHTPLAPQLVVVSLDRIRSEECIRPATTDLPQPPGEGVAVAFGHGGQLLIQLREPAALFVATENVTIPLSADSRADTGHIMFHSNSGGVIACASCHPEAGDDGRVWRFAQVGPLRTQNLRGGLFAPFHWLGDLPDLAALMDETFVRRMQGPPAPPAYVQALAHWLQAQPALPPVRAPDPATERGAALFEDARTGCAACHIGPQLNNPAGVDVGTGRPLQVPPLSGLSHRGPFMHDGCAATLTQRFTNPACGGGDRHGTTSHLAADQIADLVAYLESL